MYKFDLHVHSKYSFDSLSSVERILEKANVRNLDGVAITDHNTIKGGRIGQIIRRETGPLVIPGSEIKTDKGEIIGLFLTNEIPTRDLSDVISMIHAQDGLVLLPHPLRNRNFYQLREILAHHEIDLIEALNSRSSQRENRKAIKIGKQKQIPGVAGSDAHMLQNIGRACTYVPNFSTFEELKDYLRKDKVYIAGSTSPLITKLYSFSVSLFKKFSHLSK